MATQTLHILHEHLRTLLTQGLQHVAPGDLETLVQDFATAGLGQPAALLNQIRAHLAAGQIGQKDAEALIKTLQIVAQADIQLSALDSVDAAHLSRLDGYTGVYLNAKEAARFSSATPAEILSIANPFVRGTAVAAYLKTATEQALQRSLDILWCDASLSTGIVAGLCERPSIAMTLATSAFSYENLVMQQTALLVWQAIGVQPAYKQTVLDNLQALLKKSKEPLRCFIEAAIAHVEGRYDLYVKAQQIASHAYLAEVQRLASEKVGERRKAVKALARTKNPVFTEALVRALDDPDREAATAAFKGLATIGGVTAIPLLAQKLANDPRVEVFSHHAAETLYALGDRRGLEYFLSRKLSFPLEVYVSFHEFGLLVVHPLLRLIKHIPQLLNYADNFRRLFENFRSPAFAEKITAIVERDAELAERLRPLLQQIAPGQPAELVTLIDAVFGEPTNKIVATLKHSHLLAQTLITPDGQQALLLGMNGELKIWQIVKTKWKQIATLRLPARHPKFFQIALTPDARYLATTNNQAQTIDIWEYGCWEKPGAVLKHKQPLYAAAFSADGQYVLAGGETTITAWQFKAKTFWSAAGWKEAVSLTGHTFGVEVIKSVPGKSLIVTGDRSGLLQVWETTGWKLAARLKVNGTLCNSVAVSPDGAYLAAVENLGTYLRSTVNIWATATWQIVAQIALDSPNPVTALAFTPDAKYLLAGGSGLFAIDSGNWQEALRVPGAGDVRTIAVFPDSKHVLAGVNIWELDWRNPT